MSKEQIIEQMARAACKLRQADYEWTDEEMEIFMYKDPVGMRDMEKMRRVARVMYECMELLPIEDRYKDITKEQPQDYEQVLVTDGKEYRVLHREEGAWAFEVAPCDRDAMKYWKKLVD